MSKSNVQIDDLFTFGSRLKHIRNERGFTQKQLGIICNFPDKAADIRIRQYESDKRHPKDDIINILSNSLKISPLMLTLQTTDIQTLLFLTVLWTDIANIDKSLKPTKNTVTNPSQPLDLILSGIIINDKSPLYYWLKAFYDLREQYTNGYISLNEYKDWRYLWTPLL